MIELRRACVGISIGFLSVSVVQAAAWQDTPGPAPSNTLRERSRQTSPPAPTPPSQAEPKPADTAPPPDEPTAAPAPPAEVDPKWLDRMSKEDRAALDVVVGYGPTAIPADIKWIGGDPTTWDLLRGKVIVIQSFTTANMAGRKWPERLANVVEDMKSSDVRAIAVHTPEEAEKAEEFFAKRKPPESIAVLVDPTGEFCDALGIYKEPVNLVIDRHGAIRYAGLNPNGLKQAVAHLLAEPFDPKKAAAKRPAESAASPDGADFPPIVGSVGRAKDFRGQTAPQFYVSKWLTDQPNPRGKVVMVEFWATWCPPCVANIPHMNELAKRFGDKLCIVGISDEDQDDFEKGLDKKNLKLRDFQYAIALDPSDRMSSTLSIAAIPHCIVMSSDWVVRWQGNPGQLRAETIEQIIKADEAQRASAGDSSGNSTRRRGWTSPGS